MHRKPARLHLSRCRVFRPGLFAALLLLAGFATPRAQSQPAPELQLTVIMPMSIPNWPTNGGPIGAVGWDGVLRADAQILNPRSTNGIIPVVLSITGSLPLLGGGTNEAPPGLVTVTASSAAAFPGHYEVVARASTAGWVARMNDMGYAGASNWLDSVFPPADRMELTATQQVTIVGLSGVTASAYHVALGDPVTFTAALNPADAAGEAFSWVFWDWLAAWYYFGSGSNYTRVMDASGRDANGGIAVTATCGTSVVTVPITVYQITNVTASSNLISTAESVTLTANLNPDPGTNSLPITWWQYLPDPTNQFSVYLAACGTGPTLTVSNLAPGAYTYYARCGASEASTTVTATFQGTLTLAADALDIKVGSGVTFTASTAPALPPDFATWSGRQSRRIVSPATVEATVPDLNGGFTKTFYFDNPDEGSDSPGQTVTVRCGDTSASQNIRVYAVQGVTASTNVVANMVAVTSNAQFTAVLNRAGPSPPPIGWYVDGTFVTNSPGTTFDYAFTNVGQYVIEARLGSSQQSNTVTVAFAGQINLTASAEDIALGDLVDFTTTLTPAVTPNAISWVGDAMVQILPFGLGQFPSDAAGLLSCTVRYDSPGEKAVTITCDNSSTNKTIRVFEVTSLTASESLVALGSNVNFSATRNLVGGNPPPLIWTVNGTARLV